MYESEFITDRVPLLGLSTVVLNTHTRKLDSPLVMFTLSLVKSV